MVISRGTGDPFLCRELKGLKPVLEGLLAGECPEELERAEDQVVSVIGIDSRLAKTDEAEAPIGHRPNTEVAEHVIAGQAVVVCA